MNNQTNLQAIESALMQGDLGKLPESQRLEYYQKVCDSLGLNPLTQPFQYMHLNGKTVLYATRACTEQLRKIHNISVEITNRDTVKDIYIVTAKATMGTRVDESTGAVNIANLKGDALANALMKTETKAKRRVTLSISGLAFLDESELETIPPEKKQQIEPTKIEQKVTSIEKPKFKLEPSMIIKVKDLGAKAGLAGDEFLTTLKTITGKESSGFWGEEDYQNVVKKLTEMDKLSVDSPWEDYVVNSPNKEPK